MWHTLVGELRSQPLTSKPPPRSTRARSKELLTAAIGPTLLRLAAPMLVGIAAVVLFQVVDTYFVGQLGPEPLAAMSFTFPVAFVIFSVSMGIGIGTTAVIGQAIGEGDRSKVKRLATHALMLAGLLVSVLAGLGLAFGDHLFRAMGASESMMPIIDAYMTPWFMGVAFLVVPMVGNSAIRATGDTKSPAVIMMIAGLVNVVLDPLLIFGWGPFPRLELKGAALATVGSWLLTFIAAAWLLVRREKLILLRNPQLGQLWDSWKRVLYVGLPAAGTNVLVPLSTGLLTRIVAGHGVLSVAAFGVGTRIDMLALIGVNALSTAMTPFVSQNHGAGQAGRVRGAISFVTRAGLLWGGAVAALLFVGATPIARLFNDDPVVVAETASYLRTVPLSYCSLGVAMLMNTTFTALSRPLEAAIIIVVRLFALALPLAWLGSRMAGIEGVFGGIAAGNAAIGLLAYALMRLHLRRPAPQAQLS